MGEKTFLQIKGKGNTSGQISTTSAIFNFLGLERKTRPAIKFSGSVA
jgi:hypothetical protein